MTDHEHDCGTSRRLRAMLRERDDEIERLRATLGQLQETLETGSGLGFSRETVAHMRGVVRAALAGTAAPASVALLTRNEFQRELEAHAERTPHFIRTLLDMPWESWPLLLRNDICTKLGVEPVQMFRRVAEQPSATRDPGAGWVYNHDTGEVGRTVTTPAPCPNCCGAGYFGLNTDCRACGGTGKQRT